MTLDYHTMRAFADSWGLLFMFLMFVGVLLWTFRPGSNPGQQEAASIPFKED